VSRTVPVNPYEELFLDNLEMIERIVRCVGHQYRMLPQDADDFDSTVKLKLIENDYRILREWDGDGRSSLKTYLAFVIQNIRRDLVRAEIGRKRSSSAARELGKDAEELEQLLGLDWLSQESAFQLLHQSLGISRDRFDELVPLVKPRRTRWFQGEEALENRSTDEPGADEWMILRERQALRRRALEVVAQAVQELPKQDQLVLRMWAQGVKKVEIAKSLGLEQMPFYKRFDKLKKELRRPLDGAGIRWEDVRDTLGLDDPAESRFRKLIELFRR
jgi:RNA polymerase sigma factor (sigma-70 family)